MRLYDKKNESCALYLITPPILEVGEFKEQLVEALKPGLVKVVQLRLKGVDDQDVIEVGKTLRPICHHFDTTFIVNDRPDLAIKIGADGVHLGEKDSNVKNARVILGSSAIIGVSCYNSKHKAMLASEQGANYVAFGAFHHTKTKVPKYRARLDIIEDWSYISNVACVAIGGLTANNCSNVVSAGADYIAVISAVWNDKEGPMKAVMKFTQVLNQ